MSSEEIEQIVAQRVTEAIKAIVVYKIKIRMAHDPIGSDHGINSGQQQNKRCGVVRAHTVGPSNKKRTLVPATTQRPPRANQKLAVTYFGCGAQGHFKSKCPRLKNQNRGNQKGKKGKTRENSNVVKDNADA
ncbi:reverse transcriptase domain-containing protein [Tanacetum coccineum]